jgi:uncharacterized membrane protein
MTDPTTLYLLMALLASAVLAIGLAMMKSRGAALPAAAGTGVFAAVGLWLSDPVWLGGLALQVGGYVIYLVALRGAPVSLLAVPMQGGVALFVVLAVVTLRERATMQEWLGIIGIVAAIILLGLSMDGNAPTSVLSPTRLVSLTVIAVLAVGFVFTLRDSTPDGIAPAIASGLAFGMASLYAKAVVDGLASGSAAAVAFFVLATPWTYLAIAGNLFGLVLLQNSFHSGRGIIVMPLSSACANVVPIVGGFIAFGEQLPSAGGPAALRVASFALTIIAGGLLAVTRESSDTRAQENAA